MLGIVSYPSWGVPHTTAAGGTAFTALIPGHKDLIAKIVKFAYTNPAAAHILYFMRPLAKVTLSASVADAATSIVLASDPGAWGTPPTVAANPIAANDYISYQKDDGTQEVRVPSVVAVAADGTVTLTVTAVGAAITKSPDRYVYFYGIKTDSDPNTGLAHYLVKPPVNSTTIFDGNGSAFVSGIKPGDPILVFSDNATTQGYLEYLNAIYGQ
jgi:hypothetical protein